MGIAVVFVLGPPGPQEMQEMISHAAKVEGVSTDAMWIRYVGEKVEVDHVIYSEARMRGHVCPAITVDVANVQTGNRDAVEATLSDPALREAGGASLGLVFKTEWMYTMTGPS